MLEAMNRDIKKSNKLLEKDKQISYKLDNQNLMLEYNDKLLKTTY
jgi:hypothetical protein